MTVVGVIAAGGFGHLGLDLLLKLLGLLTNGVEFIEDGLQFFRRQIGQVA